LKEYRSRRGRDEVKVRTPSRTETCVFASRHEAKRGVEGLGGMYIETPYKTI